MEALVCGTPFAGFGVGMLPALASNMQGGTVADERSVDSLATAIGAQLNRRVRREELRVKARALALSETIRPLDELYGELLNG
jgi:hypothetical protein